MKKTKLLVFLTLALLLCLALCACGGTDKNTAETTPDTTVAYAPLEFDSKSDYGFLTGVVGIGEFTGTDLVIPKKTADGQAVSCIYSGAFKDCTNLKSITIQSNIRGIYDTFEGCTSLESFVVSEDNSAFVAIDGVLYASSMLRIDRYPAAKAGTTYTVPETIEYIGSCAFEGSSLVEITLPATLESIEDRAFANCESLTTIRFGGTMEQWDSINAEGWQETLVGCSIVCSDGTR